LAVSAGTGSDPLHAPARTGASLLEVRSLGKSYFGVPALSGVDLAVQAGEVHALLGGNGSGKSTLIKVLAGLHHGEPGGTVRVGDQVVGADVLTPRWSASAGLAFVHQDPGLVPELSVAENLALVWGFPRSVTGIGWRRLRRDAEAALQSFDLNLSADTPAERLRPAQRVLVAIVRALAPPPGLDPARHGNRVLVLDEPTAALPAGEVRLLLDAIRRHAEQGRTVLYVTHWLDEVPEVADSVTVLRDGVVAARRRVADLRERELFTLVAGRELGDVYPDAGTVTPGEPVLRVRGLSGGPVRGVDLDVRAGEVLGVGGLVGSGRSTLLRLLFGLQRRTGAVELDGVPLPSDPAELVERKVAYVPEDRAREGAFLDLSVRENLHATDVRRYWRGFLRSARERADATATMRRFQIRAASSEALAASLSGGNQQKVVLARWLARAPRLVLLDEPTQGVDVGARADIYRLIRRASEEGAAVLMVSSDPEELVNLCDRVAVLAKGQLVAEGSRGNIDRAWLLDRAYAAPAPPAGGAA